MGTAANPVLEQPSSETTSDQVEALLEAARYDDLDDVVSLASSGVSLDSKDSLGRTDGSTLWISEEQGVEAFYCRIQVTTASNKNGVFLFTALHMAAANGHLDVVEYLVNRGVDLNAINEEKNTPLHWACLNGHIEVVKKLILAGANVTELNSYERTPMDEAVSGGKMDVIDAINAAVAQLELTGISVS
nr:ankyrin repeat-containing protein p16f5.05c [Quercus suber]